MDSVTSKDQVSYLLAKLCWHTCTCQNATSPSVQHGVYCVYEQARASMPTHEPPAEQLPSAWIKGHTLHTDAGIEYDEEVVPGSDRPKGDGWHPLYSRPAGQFICPHGKDVRHLDCAQCSAQPPPERLCPNCEKDEVGTFTADDWFLYGLEKQFRLVAKDVLFFRCMACGLEFTGEDGEQKRLQAVRDHLERTSVTKPACNCEGPQKIGPGYHAPYCATMAGTEFAKRYAPPETKGESDE